MFAGRHVLAGRVDDQLLLAVDDLAGSRRRRSRRCRPCAASRRRRAPRRSCRAGCGSRAITTAPRTSTSPSSASLISTPGARRADGADLDRARAGCRCPTPQVSDMPHSSASAMPIAWKNSSTSRGVGAAPTLTAIDLVEAEHRAQPREHLLVGLRRPRRRAPRAPARPPARAGPCGSPHRARPAPPRAPRRAGRRASPPGRPSASPRSAARRRTRSADHRQVGDDLARVGAAGDRHPEDDRQVVVGGALGDVRRRQPRDHLAAVGELDDLPRSLSTAASRLRCTSSTPLGGPVVPEV